MPVYDGDMVESYYPDWLAPKFPIPPSFLAGIKRGMKELKEGKIIPWEDVRRELGLPVYKVE